MGFLSGSLHPNWKGGKTVTAEGYVRFTAGENRHKLEHRVMWEKEKGPIPAGFDVHHKNEKRWDNRMENFELRESLPHRWDALTRWKKRLDSQ